MQTDSVSKIITAYTWLSPFFECFFAPLFASLFQMRFFPEFHRNSHFYRYINFYFIYQLCVQRYEAQQLRGHATRNSLEIMQRITVSTFRYFTRVQPRHSSSFLFLSFSFSLFFFLLHFGSRANFTDEKIGLKVRL